MVSATRFAMFPTAIGPCGVAWRDEFVVATRLPDSRPETTARFLETRRNAVAGIPPKAIQRAIDVMTCLLDGERPDLSSIRCNLSNVDPFAVKVYEATRALIPGETTTYGAIAAEIGKKRDARKVGKALGRNPIPIVVPCHRVLGAGGRLAGFSAPGGVALKLRMLQIEGAKIDDSPELFEDLPLLMKKR